MGRLPIQTRILLVIDGGLLIACLLHIPNVFERSRPPFEVSGQNGLPVVERILDDKSAAGLMPGDVVHRWNGEPVYQAQVLEFLGDMAAPGREITVAARRDGASISLSVSTIPYYGSPRFVIIILIVGCVTWCFGVMILLRSRPPVLASSILHWTVIAFSVTILMTQGRIQPGSLVSAVERLFLLLAYGSVAPLFFYFTILYPAPRTRFVSAAAALTFGPAVIIISMLAFLHISDILQGTSASFSSFQSWFDVLHGSLFIFVGGGVFNILWSHARARSLEEKQKLRWLMWGMTIGSAPFLLLHVLPQLIAGHYLLPEEYTLVFFLAVPFAFSVSFLRYRLLDIDLVINRTVVYSVLSVLLMTVYGIIVLGISTIMGGETSFDEFSALALGTLAVAVALNPIRTRVQRILDETLFKARTEFRKLADQGSLELRMAVSRTEVHARLVRILSGFLPARAIAFYEAELPLAVLTASSGPGQRMKCPLPAPLAGILRNSEILIRSAAGTRQTDTGTSAGDHWLAENGWSAILPLVSGQEKLLGFAAISLRVPSERLRTEERDLAILVGREAANALSRIALEERFLVEQREKNKAAELSDLKSYIMSSMSHELRMPLTSIRIFAETLRKDTGLSRKKQSQYLNIIEGETERLSRLIGNILDFSRIERGVKEYAHASADLGGILRGAVGAMEYQFSKEGVPLKTKIPKRLPLLQCDADALQEAVMNLLSNALKYSAGKAVNLTVRLFGSAVEITVADKGIGIAEGELRNIFQPFYRVADPKARQIGGSGLGLAIVRHIVEAHGGAVSVRSSPGNGSVFTIHLPLNKEHNR